MKAENICLSSKTIDIAESDSYLTLTNMLCYYDHKNLNNVVLPFSGCEEEAKEFAQTLINQPVQARYKKVKGKDDFGGHELSIDKNGNAVFGTASIGTHTDAWIENADVTTVDGEKKNLPCLFAKSRIWKRNSNVVGAIKRLFSEKCGLNTSWEISTNSYEYSNGIKKLTDYEFIGNCLLGSLVTPAYSGTSKTLSVASEILDGELIIAEALTLDMCEDAFDINNNKEDDSLKNKDVNLSSSEENNEGQIDETVDTTATDEASVVITDETPSTSEENKEKEKKEDTDDDSENNETNTETSALTIGDLRRKVSSSIGKTGKDCYVAYIFPEEHEVWAQEWSATELDYLKYTYSIDGDEVSVSEPEEVTLTVAPRSINTTISEYEEKISEKDELIANASTEINSLNAQIAELTVYKEKFEQAEAIRIENEIAKQKEELISSVVKTGQITMEEIKTSEEIKSMVDALDKKGLMAIVGERLSSSISDEKKEVETSENKETVNVSTNLNSDDDEELSVKDMSSIMRNYIKKVRK